MRTDFPVWFLNATAISSSANLRSDAAAIVGPVCASVADGHRPGARGGGVCAGGDIEPGAAPGTLAWGAGKTAARSIDRYLRGRPLLNDQEQEALKGSPELVGAAT